ncbi:MAG: CDP-diacylglycerol--serine O-phosphatidyltransferase, partial [Sulfuricurvum sp.]|nr:CDP-diacylglycerol--serine O-phosphatidyltransferase [Sulfuricurvum sp.]
VIERYEEFVPFKVFILPLALVLAILMVSNIRYPSFKKMNFKTFHFIRFLIGLIVVAMGVFIYPIEGMALLAAGYLFYGPLRASFYLLRRLFYRG